MDGGFPHPGTMPLNNIKNGMTPNDQVRKMYPVDYAISTIFILTSSNIKFDFLLSL